MKKFLNVVMLFSMTCLMFLSCSKSENVINGEKVNLQLSSSNLSINVGGKSKLTITASENVEKDLVVSLISSDKSIKVPATLTIKAGEKTVEGEVEGISLGSSKISISADGVEYGTKEVTISVEELDGKMTISLKIEKNDIGIEDVVLLTALASDTAEEDIEVLISKTGTAVKTFKKIVIKSGEEGSYAVVKGIEVGTSEITITVEGVKVLVNKVVVNVTKPETPVIEKLNINREIKFSAEKAKNDSKYVDYANFSYLSFAEFDGSRVTKYPGTLYLHQTNYLGSDEHCGVFATTVDTYGGSYVYEMKNEEAFFKSIPLDTPINDDLTWGNSLTTKGRFANIRKQGMDAQSLSNGVHYIVCSMPEGVTSEFAPIDNYKIRRCWLKIEINNLDIKLLDGAMCLNGADFKVGQK
ncbi:MAG: hypothetical protein IMY73_02575 [Bacteroidetes bacterium]|nr:hypothetical protein [Bacteroidota bacterium]